MGLERNEFKMCFEAESNAVQSHCRMYGKKGAKITVAPWNRVVTEMRALFDKLGQGTMLNREMKNLEKMTFVMNRDWTEFSQKSWVEI